MKARGRTWWMAISALALMAAVGQVILVRAGIGVLVHAGLPGDGATVPGDVVPLLTAAQAFIHGQPASPSYGTNSGLVYAPPYAIVLGPIGLLPTSVALGFARVAALCCETAALMLWVSESKQRQRLVLVLLLTIPAFQVVMNGQLMAGSGMLALTLAIWAQRRHRWLLAGAALAFGFIRISNALPVAAMLIVVASARPRDLAALGAGFALVLAPLGGLAFAWDAHWIGDFLINIHAFRLSGPLRLVQISFGTPGVAAVTAVTCSIAAYISRVDRGNSIDLDRGAAVMAMSVLTATLAGMYTAVFALPALVRMGTRPQLRMVPWVFAAGGWLVVFALSPLLLGRDPLPALNYLDTVGPIVIVMAAYPLIAASKESTAVSGDLAGI